MTFMAHRRRLNARLRQAQVTIAHLHDTIGRLRYALDHDPTTGLLNGEAAMAAAHLYIQAHPDAVLAFVDVDRFKLVNDTYGHKTGDLLLAAVATTLNATFGETGIVGRSYRKGDEFVVVTTTSQVRWFTGLTSEPDDLPAIGWPVTMSVGWTGTAGLSLDEAKTHADTAMRVAKTAFSHGGGVVEHDPARHRREPVQDRPRHRQSELARTVTGCPATLEHVEAA